MGENTGIIFKLKEKYAPQINKIISIFGLRVFSFEGKKPAIKAFRANEKFSGDVEIKKMQLPIFTKQENVITYNIENAQGRPLNVLQSDLIQNNFKNKNTFNELSEVQLKNDSSFVNKISVIKNSTLNAFSFAKVPVVFNGFKSRNVLHSENWNKTINSVEKTSDYAGNSLAIPSNALEALGAQNIFETSVSNNNSNVFENAIARVRNRQVPPVPLVGKENVAPNSFERNIVQNIYIEGNMIGNSEFLEDIKHAFSKELTKAMVGNL